MNDRRVLLLMSAVVALVLLVDVATAMVPGMDAALAAVPIVIVVVLVGTLLVLARSVRGR